jgi:hypothetical protein
LSGSQNPSAINVVIGNFAKTLRKKLHNIINFCTHCIGLQKSSNNHAQFMPLNWFAAWALIA